MRSIVQEDLAILNVFATKKRGPKYVRQKLTELDGEMDKSVTVVGDFNIPFSVIGR